MYLVCFFGVIGRSIKYTSQSHVTCILDVLKENNIPYKVLVVNNNIGNALIDGTKINNEYKDIIESDFDVELHQKDIDDIIYKTYPEYWKIFKNRRAYILNSTCLNALRASYIEHCVSLNIQETFDKVIAISGDFQLIHPIPISDIINLNKNELIVSNMNRGNGYTDGLYIGSSINVKKTMDHFFNLKNDTTDYEQIIKHNTEKHNINVISKRIIFSKIRANRSIFIKDERLKKKIRAALDRDYPM